MGNPRKSRKVDSKGRVLLGADYSDSTVLIEEIAPGEFVIKTAMVVPSHEAWLYENPKALSAVLSGINNARKKKLGKNTKFKADASWIDDLEG